MRRALLAIFLLFTFLGAEGAWASLPPPHPACNPHNSQYYPSAGFNLNITAVAVGCFRGIIGGEPGQPPQPGTVMYTIQKLSEKLKSIMGAVLTLYLVIFGFKIMFGKGGESMAEIMKTILAISIMVFVVLGSGLSLFYEWFLDMQNDLIVRMIEQTQLWGINGLCEYPQGKEYLRAWYKVDCVIKKMLLYGVFGAGIAVVVGFAVLALFSGPVGLAMFLVVMIFIGMLFTAMARSVYSYLVSQVFIALLFSVSPVMVPLYLFPSTRGYFNNWLAHLLSYGMQPVILFAFLALMLGLLNHQADEITKTIGTALSSSRKIVLFDVRPCIPLYFKTVCFNFFRIDMDAVSDVVTGVGNALVEMLVAVILVYLLISFMTVITGMAHELAGAASAITTGDGGMVPSRIGGGFGAMRKRGLQGFYNSPVGKSSTMYSTRIVRGVGRGVGAAARGRFP